MNKNELKKALEDLRKDDEVDFVFRDSLEHRTGKYVVLETKVGPGQKGSMIATLRLASDQNAQPFEVKTKNNEDVVSVSFNGNTFGIPAGSFDPNRKYPADVMRAEALKSLFSTLKEGNKIKLESEKEPYFTGTFTVVSSQKTPGRFSQMFVELERDGGEIFEVWSYRHSGAISGAELVSATTT